MIRRMITRTRMIPRMSMIRRTKMLMLDMVGNRKEKRRRGLILGRRKNKVTSVFRKYCPLIF